MKFSSKQEVREYVWKILKEKDECLFPCYGRIPNFKGVEKTIEKILNLEEFKNAKRIFVSPDTPQRLLLKFINLEEKEIYMATPRLKEGFVRVNIKSTNLKEILSKSIKIQEIPKIDLAIIGSVAVDIKGNRIGKGGGYGDKEIKILKEKNEKIKIVSNVHDLQVFEDLSYLMKEYDQKIDIIVTPTRIIRC